MLAYNEALALIKNTARNRLLSVEKLPLSATPDRLCAKHLTAGRAIQPFDNAAMDGYAIRYEDLIAAGPSSPIRLIKAGTVAAGQDASALKIEKNTCWHVMTGAPLPAGSEAVIPVENAHAEEGAIIFTAAPEKGQHIRRAGEDFRKGDPLLAPGDKIGAAHILPLATLGIAHITVYRQPRILFIPTGAEIIDDLAAPLGPGQIYNSNRFYAEAFLKSCGAAVTLHDTIRDDQAAFVKAIENIEPGQYDIVISSGAVSMGSFDFVKDSLTAAGAEILFHKLRLKPGKPNLFATLPCGALYFGLPGNPAATAVGLRFFVAPALRMMRGQKAETPLIVRAATPFHKKPGLHMILKGRYGRDAQGHPTVTILDGQESFKVSPFLEMDCWLHMPEAASSIDPGAAVETYPLAL